MFFNGADDDIIQVHQTVSRYGASIINQVKLAGPISLRKDLLSTGIVPDELRRQR